MADLRKLREQRKQVDKPAGALARAKQRNGAAPKPVARGALAALKAGRSAPQPALARARQQRRAPLPKPTRRKQVVSGLTYDRCRKSEHGDWWLIDVSNGDKLVTFHNRYGSWMHDATDGAERGVPMVEPEAAFQELANQSSPRHVTFGIFNYWVRELHHLGLPATKRERELAREKAEKEAAEKAKAAAKAKPKGALAKARGKAKSKPQGALAKAKQRRS